MPAARDGRRLLWSALLLAVALNAAYGGLGGIVIPSQVALVDESRKEVGLAVVMTSSSLVTLVVSPWVGALSDRTRSRWGRRSPWILGAAVAAVPAVLSLGWATSVLGLTLGWVAAQALLNAVQSPFEAAVADGVDRRQRGRAGSFLGVGVAAGLALGVVWAARLVDRPVLATGALAGLVLVAAVVFVRQTSSGAALEGAVPEAALVGSAAGATPRASTVVATLVSLWRHDDFRRVFVGRFALVLGNQMISSYMLFILMDHVGLTRTEAAAQASLVVGVHTVCLGVGAALTGRWTDRLGRRKPFVVVSTVVVAAALVVPLVSPTVGAVLVYAVVAGLGRGVYLAVDTALMIDVLPEALTTGRDLAVLGLAQVLPQTLAPVVAALLLSATGGAYEGLFVLAIALVLVSLVPVLRIRGVA
ncbi:MFS transporter [Sanguibacter keddieii]|nr:MFS transporter [Sanguibacter keddieii]